MITVPRRNPHPYRLEQSTALVTQTHWCKEEWTQVPSGVWWITGGGLNREATEVEVSLWVQLQEALKPKCKCCGEISCDCAEWRVCASTGVMKCAGHCKCDRCLAARTLKEQAAVA
jgi:hypothetical protein